MKKQRHHFASKEPYSQGYFSVVVYGCESWIIKKAECWRTDALKLWYWRILLWVPCTARRLNQPILKEINPEYSLEVSRKCMFLGSLSCHNKDLEQRTLEPSAPALCKLGLARRAVWSTWSLLSGPRTFLWPSFFFLATAILDSFSLIYLPNRRIDAEAETPILWPPDVKTLMLGKIEHRRRRDDKGWDGWMASLIRWTWVWANSRSWWWTGKSVQAL